MERVGGIEPPSPAWKAGALPLSYTRLRRTFTGLPRVQAAVWLLGVGRPRWSANRPEWLKTTESSQHKKASAKLFYVGPDLTRGQGGPAASGCFQLRRADGDVLGAVAGLHLEELAAQRVTDFHDLTDTGSAFPLEPDLVAFLHCLLLIKDFVVPKVPADLESASGIAPDFGCRALPLELR